MRRMAIAAAMLSVIVPAAAQNLKLDELLGANGKGAPASRPTSRIDLWLDRPDGRYGAGEPIALSVRASEDGYVTAFSIGPQGEATQLYPNLYHPENFVHGGEIASLPGAGARTRLAAPAGIERIQVILCRFASPVGLQGANRLDATPGINAATEADLASADDRSGILAVAEKTFRSDGGPGGASVGAGGSEGVKAGLATAPYVAIPARGFPLPRL